MRKWNKNSNMFPVISNTMGQEMRLREYFLNISLDKIKESPNDDEVKEVIKNKNFYCVHGKHCMYCASKDICLEHSVNAGGE